MADAASFDAFYRAVHTRVSHQVYAVVGDLSEAQDVSQEALARAWLHWDRLADYDSPESWVRMVALRLAANRWRRGRNRLLAQLRHGPPGTASGPSEDSVAIIAALRRLPYNQRLVIVLHHLVGRSVAEVAEEIGAPVGTVKARLSRARRTLAPLLASTEPGHDQVPSQIREG